MEEPKYINYDNYINYLDAVQRDYNDQLKELGIKYKVFSTIRAISVALIPLVLVLEIDVGIVKIAIAALSVIGSLCEYFIRFNDYDKKLNTINIASCKLMYEGMLYTNHIEDYEDSDKAMSIYIRKTLELINETDSQTYRKYNSDAFEQLKSTVNK